MVEGSFDSLQAGEFRIVLGKALADVDTPLIFSTKLGNRPKPFEPTTNAPSRFYRFLT